MNDLCRDIGGMKEDVRVRSGLRSVRGADDQPRHFRLTKTRRDLGEGTGRTCEYAAHAPPSPSATSDIGIDCEGDEVRRLERPFPLGDLPCQPALFSKPSLVPFRVEKTRRSSC